jgi:hypothetical protein
MKGFSKIQNFLLLISTIVILNAGDPCPISFEFYDTGVPNWLEKEKILDSLESQAMWVGISYKTAKGGAVITHVAKGSSASKAGLKVNDIIQKMNGKSIHKTKDVSREIDVRKIGDTLRFELLRQGKKKVIAMKIGRKDPLCSRLKMNIHDCNRVETKQLIAAQIAKVQKKLFVNGKRFNCQNAHTALAKLKMFHGDGGELVMIRGSKRVLLAHVGQKTLCVQSAKFDGMNLNRKNLQELSYKLFDDYIQDRYRNP